MTSKEKKEVRMGDTCQVALTEVETSYVGDHAKVNYRKDLDIMIWNAGAGLTDEDVVGYLKYAAHTYRIPGDKALYILHACNNDIEKAKFELKGYMNLDDEWTSDDDRVFWYAFNAFGKNFAKIKQLMPHKKIGSIVCHYYATKKHQHYKSMINDDITKPDFDLSDDDTNEPESNYHVFYICKNCGGSVKKTYFVNMLEVCKACKLYFKAANEHRPANRPTSFDKRIICPKEMKEIAQQFVQMAQDSKNSTLGSDEDVVCCDKPRRTVCDDLIEETKSTIHTKKSAATTLNMKNGQVDIKKMCDIDRASEILERISVEKSSSRQRHSHTWSDFEKAAAFHCLVRFNKDYEAVAEVLGSKSTEMVRAFAIEHEDLIKKEIEKEALKEEDLKMDNPLPQIPIDFVTIDD